MNRFKLKDKPKRYRYQLTKYIRKGAYKKSLNPFIEQFKKYKDEDYACIVENDLGCALWTLGLRQLRFNSNGYCKQRDYVRGR